MEPAVAKSMIKGSPDPLTSAFSLRYSMLLSLARVEGATPEGLLARSFRQWQARGALPALTARADEYAAKRDAIRVMDEERVEELLGLMRQRALLADSLRAATVTRPDHVLRFLQPGRLVKVSGAPPNASRPLPQLGPFPVGAVIGRDNIPGWCIDERGSVLSVIEGQGVTVGAAAAAEAGGEGSDGDLQMEGDGSSGVGPSLSDIMRKVDG